jgi:hypothetical protein
MPTSQGQILSLKLIIIIIIAAAVIIITSSCISSVVVVQPQLILCEKNGDSERQC